MGQPVVHFEIGCRDRAKTERFFADLFGWNIQQAGPASMIDTASPRGIPGHITSLNHEPFHYTIFYVGVDDVKAYLDSTPETADGEFTLPMVTAVVRMIRRYSGNRVLLWTPILTLSPRVSCMTSRSTAR